MKTLILLLAATIAAQTPARDTGAVPVAAPAGTASLAGIVRDGDGNPLRRASVSIRGDMSLNRTTVTDDEGRFGFTQLPQGRFTITATKASYPPMSYGAKRPFRTGPGLMLTDGQQIGGLILTVPKGGVITGTVYDDRGRPMPEVPVMAWEFRSSLSGERTVDYPATGGEWVTTDDRGVYRIFGLPPGEYTAGTAWFYGGSGNEVRTPSDAEIRAAFDAVTRPPAPSGPSASAAPPPPPPLRDFAPVFAPGALDPMVAMSITLAAGEERQGVDLHMQRLPRSSIEVTVTGPDGQGVRGEIRVGQGGGSRAVTTVSGTDANGKYTSRSLSPGSYSVVFQSEAAPDRPALWATAEATISGAEPITLNLTAQPALSVSGRVTFTGTELPAPDITRARVSLLGLSSTASVSGRNNSNGAADANGRFTIEGVSPGRYRLSATAPVVGAPGGPAWRVDTVTYGGRDVTDLPIEVWQADNQPLNVTFTDQASELTGQLTTEAGQPATDYFVVVLPANKDYWLSGSRRIVSARPDATGRYVFRGLPAGQYLISAATDLVTQDLREQSALAQIAAAGQPFALTLGEKKTFDIRIK